MIERPDISKLFTHDRNRKRVDKEISKLLSLSHPNINWSYEPFKNGLMIHVFLKVEAEVAKNLHDLTCLQFTFIIQEDYPFSLPQLLLRTEVSSEISLNDHRNLLFDVLNSRWGPAYLIADIVRLIPSFVERIARLVADGNFKELGVSGTFNEDQFYFREVIDQTSLLLFQCKQKVKKKGYVFSSVVDVTCELGLTDSYLTLFQTAQGKLVNRICIHYSEKPSFQIKGELLLEAELRDQVKQFQFRTEEDKLAFLSLLMTKLSSESIESVCPNASLMRKRQMKLQSMIALKQGEESENPAQQARELLKLYSDLVEVQSALALPELQDSLKKLKEYTLRIDGYLSRKPQ